MEDMHWTLKVRILGIMHGIRPYKPEFGIVLRDPLVIIEMASCSWDRDAFPSAETFPLATQFYTLGGELSFIRITIT